MKMAKLVSLAVVLLFLAATPSFGYVTKSADGVETGGPDSSWLSGAAAGAGLGAALTIIGAGYGMGRIGGSAMEGMARQPEVAGRIQTGMIIIAALLEGVTFFSLIVCIILAVKAAW